MKRRVSIADVAKMAGVSISTVSRVINNTGYPVSQDVRERIMSAVKVLNYVPSLAAQRLKSDFNPLIGIIVRDISNIYFGEIAKGAMDKAMELGYLSIVCNTGRNPTNEMEFHELLWKNRVQGILLIGGGIDTPSYRSILAKQIDRSVRYGLRIAANAPQGIGIKTVTIDLVSASAQITNYLINRGHHFIGIITGNQQVITSQLHLKGFEEAMNNARIPIYPGLVKLDEFTEQSGYISCIELLRHNPRPTAIYCGCDPIAVGVLHAIDEVGLKIPQDISVISLGDTPLATHLRPPLTSIHVPRYSIGVRSIEVMLSDSIDTIDTEFIPTELIERASVRAIN